MRQVSAVHLVILLAMTWPLRAGAEDLDWTARNAFYLEARVRAEESDASLRLLCKSPDVIEVRAGAEELVGMESGKEVTLKLKSGGKQAELTGIPQPSEDSQMTGGTELAARLAPDDPFFAVLLTGKDVAVTGAGRRATWSARGMKAAVDKFLGKCKSLSQ
ncbi:MAG: hypothetical protein AB7G54_09700 [Methyloceanibacter sp.]